MVSIICRVIIIVIQDFTYRYNVCVTLEQSIWNVSYFTNCCQIVWKTDNIHFCEYNTLVLCTSVIILLVITMC